MLRGSSSHEKKKKNGRGGQSRHRAVDDDCPTSVDTYAAVNMIGYDEDLDDEKLEAMQQHQNQQEEHRRIQKRQSQKKEKRDRVYAQKLHFVQQQQQGEGTRHQQQETILPLSESALATLDGFSSSSLGVRLSPMCHEAHDSQREVRGWVLDLASGTRASKLPVPCNLFHGVSIALCDAAEADVLALMRDSEDTRARLALAVQALMQQNKKKATWKRCRPNGVSPSMYSAYKDRDGKIVFASDELQQKVIDSAEWSPEVSPDGFVGFYFRWHEDVMQRSRIQLFVVCQSYLPKACLEFADMVHQVEDACSVDAVCLSEEAQWLRTACSRNRARVIAEVCARMGVRVPTVEDYCAFCPSKTPIALVTTETLHHDMVYATEGKNRKVRIFNYCSPTQSAFNGSVCVMAPWDGIWIFKGAAPHASHQQPQYEADFGLPHGKGHVVLPTCSPRVRYSSMMMMNHGLTFSSAEPLQCKAFQLWGDHRDTVAVTFPESYYDGNTSNNHGQGVDPDVMAAYRRALSRSASASSVLVPNVPGAIPCSTNVSHYLAFDENVLGIMSHLGWNRRQGICKLLPMACALYEHWKQDSPAVSSSTPADMY